MNKSKMTLRALTEGAVMVAAAQVLSMLKLWEMPWGGSVTLAMVPILLFAVRWGVGPGLAAGFVFGILQFTFDGGFAIGWQSIIGDYLLAFTALGLAGLWHGKRGDVYVGTLIGGFARFLVHYVVGATVWAEYMPEESQEPGGAFSCIRKRGKLVRVCFFDHAQLLIAAQRPFSLACPRESFWSVSIFSLLVQRESGQ